MRRWLVRTLPVFLLFDAATTAPSGFPKSGNGLWYDQTGNVWSREWLPVGNGYLAATVPGGTQQETTQLNIETLWSGGPFADPMYNGGNKQASEQAAMASVVQDYRDWIFHNVTGNIDNIEDLTTDQGQYGSYAGAGHLLASLTTSGPISNYGRWLDLDQGLAVTSWTQGDVDLTRTTFCSNPTKSCVQHISAQNGPLPNLTYAFSVALESGLPAPNITCQNFTSLLVNGFVSNSPPGMSYAFVFSAFASTSARVQCIQFPVAFGAPPNATLQVITPANATNTEAWITWIGDTEYDINAGDAAHNFSFAGEKPVPKLQARLPITASSDYQTLLQQHTDDIKSVLSESFALDLGQKPNVDLPTDALRSQYTVDGPQSNAYLDWLLFNYGRYLLASSSRSVLPANLQGKWANGISNAWSADYRNVYPNISLNALTYAPLRDANINLQMNYWAAEMTGLHNTTSSLFDYIEKTWAPRGAYTAQVLYNISQGWVTHNEMNIFGHTGMKGGGNTAEWADYPESAVWMMFHVWDHFDHTNDVAWWKAQGWPLLKGVASFHVKKLLPDLHFNDSTLVVAPCNSPEQVPITLGCAHAQQVIWQLFNAVEKGFDSSGDTDTAFLEEVRSVRTKMDKGLRIGSWGQLQEWKVDQDSPSDTHRHLSHLIGLYPGYAITNFDPSPSVQGTGVSRRYSKSQILSAAGTSLLHRGNGTGPDADSGWEKAWRAAAWAQLQNTSMFYHELSFALSENFGPNLFSLYNPYDPDPIFQIDANFGFPAAIMNGLLQAPDVASIGTPLTVTLLPTLPPQWPSGSIRGARIRGGTTVDLQWSKGRLTSVSFVVDTGKNVRERLVNVMYDGRTIISFSTTPGLKKSIHL